MQQTTLKNSLLCILVSFELIFIIKKNSPSFLYLSFMTAVHLFIIFPCENITKSHDIPSGKSTIFPLSIGIVISHVSSDIKSDILLL